MSKTTKKNLKQVMKAQFKASKIKGKRKAALQAELQRQFETTDLENENNLYDKCLDLIDALASAQVTERELAKSHDTSIKNF